MPFNKIDRDEHQSLIDEINLLNDVKTLEDFNQIKPRIIEFFRTVKDSRYLTRLEDKIYNTDVFRSQVNINFLIELLPTVCGIAQRCIWNLMFHKLLHNRSDDEIKSQVLTALKSSVDILTKIYCYRKYSSSFTFSQWFDSFSNNSKMILHTMVIRNTQDLIEKTEEFFDSGILSLQSFYSDIVKFTIDFKNQEDKYILEKLSTYLDNLLSLWNFPIENDVVSLFKNFYDVEKDLITVLGSGYHEPNICETAFNLLSSFTYVVPAILVGTLITSPFSSHPITVTSLVSLSAASVSSAEAETKYKYPPS